MSLKEVLQQPKQRVVHSPSPAQLELDIRKTPGEDLEVQEPPFKKRNSVPPLLKKATKKPKELYTPQLFDQKLLALFYIQSFSFHVF